MPNSIIKLWHDVTMVGDKYRREYNPITKEERGGHEPRADDPIIDAQHEDTGYMWRGKRSRLPRRYNEVKLSIYGQTRVTYPIRRFDFATVTYVVDGDTCDIELDLGYSIILHHRFRLARINTPERGSPGYTEAKQFLSTAVLDKAVTLEVTKLDKYGRFLCELMVEGINVNDAILSAGLGKLYAFAQDKGAARDIEITRLLAQLPQYITDPSP